MISHGERNWELAEMLEMQKKKKKKEKNALLDDGSTCFYVSLDFWSFMFKYLFEVAKHDENGVYCCSTKMIILLKFVFTKRHAEDSMAPRYKCP